MKFLLSLVLGAALIASFLLVPAESAPAPQDAPSKEDIAKMMAQAKKFTQPGANHEILKRFLGKWNTEMRLVMGGRKTPAEKSTTEYTWLIQGRWIQGKSQGSFAGMPASSVTILGYDNFKQSFVVTMVSSMDTAMTRSEGDLTRDKKTLITYGTLDEYLTGEHDKMVKYVWRFESANKIVLEIHDLPIGEKNTQVLEIVHTRES